MSYKTISLNNKAFKLLKEAKIEGESYSETIIRLTTKPNVEKLVKMFGVLKDEISAKELEEFKQEARKAWN